MLKWIMNGFRACATTTAEEELVYEVCARLLAESEPLEDGVDGCVGWRKLDDGHRTADGSCSLSWSGGYFIEPHLRVVGGGLRVRLERGDRAYNTARKTYVKLERARTDWKARQALRALKNPAE